MSLKRRIYKTNKMKTLHQYIKQLLAADEAETAMEYLLVASKDEELADYRTEIILQSAQLAHFHKIRRENTEDYADLVRTRNKVNLALLNISENLPKEIVLPVLPKKKLAKDQTSEAKFKDRLFGLLAIAKLFIIIFLFTLWESGTFTNDQFVATVGLLVPIFVTYLSLMMKEKVAEKDELLTTKKQVKKSFARMAYGLILFYVGALFLVINLRDPGVISFPQMNGLLALIESGLGVYVSQVIFAVFKKK